MLVDWVELDEQLFHVGKYGGEEATEVESHITAVGHQLKVLQGKHSDTADWLERVVILEVGQPESSVGKLEFDEMRKTWKVRKGGRAVEL